MHSRSITGTARASTGRPPARRRSTVCPPSRPADQAHARIQSAIGTFDVFNTVFVRPRDVPPDGFAQPGPEPLERPSVERIGNVAHIALPSPDAFGSDDLRTYLRRVRLAMAEVETSAPACGWVVDLRDYGTGGWGPPVWALGGLLGEGRVVTFRSGTGEWWLEVDDEGAVSSRGFDESDDPVDSPYI